MRACSVSFDAAIFVIVTFDGDRQIIADKPVALDVAMIFVFVGFAEKAGEDRFYILDQGTLQNSIYRNHAVWLAKHGGIRPKNPKSTHVSVSLGHLDEDRDNWAFIEACLA